MIAWDAVRYVVGADGRPTAVQMDLEFWRQILAVLEDAEDVEIARAALAEFDAAGGDPEKAGWILLEDLEKEWEIDDAL